MVLVSPILYTTTTTMKAMNSRTTNGRLCVSASKGAFFVALGSMMAGLALGFSPMLPSLMVSITPSKPLTTRLSAVNKNYPPMSRDEVQAMLDTIPVYTVTEPNQEGLILLKEKGNLNDIAYFFFSPEAANTVFAPLREKQQEQQGSGVDWGVSAFPLGLVWFELVNDPEEGIEYRLLPDPENLIGAQNLLREQQKQSKASANEKLNDMFKTPFNEIPIFIDQFLRVQTPGSDGDTREKVPMYIGIKDLMDTCNEAIKASSGEYQAAMSAVDLRDLIDDMTKKEGNANDYRRAIMVPPIPEKQTGGSDAKAAPAASPEPEPEPDDALNWKGKQGNIYGKPDTEGFSTPTASNDWSD